MSEIIQPAAPIVVNPSAVPGQLEAALRQIAIALGGWLIGRGYLDAGTAAALGTVLALVVPIAWGQIANRLAHKNLVTAAAAAPDAVAQVKA